MTEETSTDILDMVTGIVANYVSKNSVTPDALPGLIASVHAALANVSGQAVEAEPEIERPSAAAIRKSIKPDGLVSFEDGRSYKSLKRHLSTRGMTPDEYRAKWGLPKDYPMVSPQYSAARSALAKQMGLGQGGRKPKAAAARGRKAKA